MFKAAKEYTDRVGQSKKVWGIGVDSDQAKTVGADLAPYVLTSMLKRVDVAVYETIKAFNAGTLKGGTTEVFDAKRDGVGYATTGDFVKDIASKLDGYKKDIIDGKIVVPVHASDGRTHANVNANTGSTLVDDGAPGSRPDTPIAIELRGITKRFPGVVANDQVDLVVRHGDVHAIVGENGSGKSTLMKTLYGQHRPDEGTIVVDGEEMQFRSPRDAIAVGIGMVHQHFMLADNLTVWENIALGDEPGSWWRIECRPRRVLASPPSPKGTVWTSTPTTGSATSASASANESRSSKCSSAAQRFSSSTSRPRCSYPKKSIDSSVRCESSPTKA